jgi:long-chain acyl-CoA synthetase
VLSYLPLCHVAEKIFTLYLPLATGSVVHFGESIDTVAEDLREVSPTVFVGVPRIWEKMHSSILVKMGDSSRLKRRCSRLGLAQGQRLSAKKQAGRGGTRSTTWSGRCSTCWCSGRCRSGSGCGAAGSPSPVPRRSPRSCCAGSTASGCRSPRATGRPSAPGSATPTPPGKVRIGTVGPVIPGVECVLGDGDEVLVRGPQVFVGYLHNEEATARDRRRRRLAAHRRRRLHRRGRLPVDHRAHQGHHHHRRGQEPLAGADREPMKTSPYIKECVAIGDGRKFISALIQIDADNVGDWASRKGIAYTSFQDLASKDRRSSS